MYDLSDCVSSKDKYHTASAITNLLHWNKDHKDSIYVSLFKILIFEILFIYVYLKSLDELTDKAVPKNIQLRRNLVIEEALSKFFFYKKMFQGCNEKRLANEISVKGGWLLMNQIGCFPHRV